MIIGPVVERCSFDAARIQELSETLMVSRLVPESQTDN
jgi:hypothetical protein